MYDVSIYVKLQIGSNCSWNKPQGSLVFFLHRIYPIKYVHGFVVLCFVVVMQSFIMNSHEVFIHIHQGCFAGTGAIVRLPQCQWSKPDGYGKISQCITTTKHSKAKTVCIFLGIYCKYIQNYFTSTWTIIWLHKGHWCSPKEYWLSHTFPNHSNDDVIKWNHLPCYWTFVWGIHRLPVNSPHKVQ